MSDRVTELFQRYLDQCAAGARPDPADVIAEAGADGEALAGMITAHLATHPAAVDADTVLALAARPELEPPRPWAQLLPELRARRGTRRDQLAARLASLLGVSGSESQVAGYVHELEAGLLSPRLVRPAVVAALAEILAVPRALLDASRGLESPTPPAAPIFARESAALVNASHMFPSEPPSDPRVDDLFTGGGDG